jgi:ABC-type lipoprotein export system ATPase subunit
MNDPKGSIWRKWDLHVHTPYSIFNNYSDPDPWGRFIQELEQLPPEFKVIGVNDYLFLDGYKYLLSEKNNDRLKNIDLLLPVIELRIDKFGGTTGHLSRVNYHIIFSNEIDPEIIEQQFLNALPKKYIISPQYNHLQTKWRALPTMQSIEELGKLIIDSVPESESKHFNHPLIEGFNNLCIGLETIQEALQSHYFERKYLTAVGKTEWADIKWNDQSIAEKKNIINGANLVFISAESVDAWAKAKKSLTDAKVNDHLLDCSDAHSFSDADYKDRIGKCFTWIKADTTFEGLLQIMNEPESRLFVGDIPDKLVHVQSNKTKYIKSLHIKRKPGATLLEFWFNNEIQFNPGLVAIIGNKGKGKSALSDIIGLLCDTKQYNDFTFLSETNFRQPGNNKAQYFEAELTWESDVSIFKGIDEGVDLQKPELVKYIPQHFLEKICNQIPDVEESEFDQELKKVIFSHVDQADRLDMTTLDELLAYKTSEAYRTIEILKQELHGINETIVSLEYRLRPETRDRIKNLLEQKKKELEALIKSPPEPVSKPETDPAKQKKIAEISEELTKAKTELDTIVEQISTKILEQKGFTKQISTTTTLITRLENLEYQIQSFINESTQDFESINLAIDKVFTYKIDKKPLNDKLSDLYSKKADIDKHLDAEIKDSLVYKKQQIEKSIETLQSSLDEPNRKYQAYLIAKDKWEKQKSEITGSKETADTIEYYKEQLEILKKLPNQLDEAQNARINKSKDIFSVIQQLSNTYRELYKPIHEFIKKKSVTIQDYQLNFDVGIVDSGFEKEFFDFISHGLAGTYCGVEDGTKMLRGFIKLADFSSADGIEAFLRLIVASLQTDMRPGGEAIEINTQLKRGKDVLSLYDMIFSLDYLKPRYSFRMGEKELHQLSPGERGTLLLIFYLLLDKSDIPLVIDQPEENLDNQTVYEVLVPCVKEAKEKRQIIMVTHNPNLAVVCDAEQIICANLDKKNNYVMEYTAGAIENPDMNQAVVDILEGTMPAFDNRDSKYIE